MNKILLLFLLLSTASYSTTIHDARRMPVGTIVTITGIALNGSEFGNQRFINDGTDAICLFSSMVASVNAGDQITVSGTIDNYHSLIELINLTSVVINTTGNPLPDKKILFPYQVKESYESDLVSVHNVSILNPIGAFAANTKYILTDGESTTSLFIKSGTNLIGQPIPVGVITVTGIASQYDYDYEIVPRNISDIFVNPLYSTAPPVISNITASGFTLDWNTNVNASSFIRAGHTPMLELGIINGNVNMGHVNVTGAFPSDIYYYQPFSVAGNDTMMFPVMMAVTSSVTAGDMKVFFNRSVNNGVAVPSSNIANSLTNSFDDTIAAVINNAQQSIDISIYSFTNSGTTQIINAINSAYIAGKTVRIIYDGNTVLSGIQQLNPAIPMLASPPDDGYYNINHNKFIIIDAALPYNAKVLTGSTNFSNDQLYNDANNLVIIQDQSLAKVYTLEFNEMWGSNSYQPDPLQARFGYYKKDNTPHTLNIGGKTTESYFSPSDNVNGAIRTNIYNATSNLYFSLMLLTKQDLGDAILQKINSGGVFVAGIVNDTSGTTASGIYNDIYNAIGNKIQIYNGQLGGILHHKYMIADQNTTSDPVVVTGSHNWSLTAETRNDENTLVIHDALIANQYFQEFWKRMQENGVVLSVDDAKRNITAMLYPVPCDDQVNIIINNKQDSEIFIYNYSGQLIEKIKTTADHTLINTSSWPDGFYIVSMYGGSALKIVVQH